MLATSVWKKDGAKDILEQNKENYDARVFEKAYNKIVPEWDRKNNPGRSREEKIDLIKNALDRSQVATNVVKKTLPSLFNMKKRASWVAAGELMEKVANLTKRRPGGHRGIYQRYGWHFIDVSVSKSSLEEQIKKCCKNRIRR